MAILEDPDKAIEGDIDWSPDQDHPTACTFRVPIQTAGHVPLSIYGRWNPSAGKLTYSLLLRGAGRIYGLDLGVRHRNPSGSVVGETHKHRWTDSQADKFAYEPSDITAGLDKPVEVWKQFCAEARISHTGKLGHPGGQVRMTL